MIPLKKLIVYTGLLLVTAYTANSQTNTIADTYYQTAEVYRKNAKPDSAIFFYEKAAVEFEKNTNFENLVNACNQAATLLTRQDKYERAKTWLEKALATGRFLPDSSSLSIATTYITLGVIANAEENYSQSLWYHNRSLSIRLAKLGENHADVATSYGNIGNVYVNSKDYDNAIDAHLKALKIREKVFGKNGVEVIQSFTNLGNAYKGKKDYGNALDNYEKALQNKILQTGGPVHKELARFYKNVSDIYYLMDNKAQGDLYKARSDASAGS